MAVRFEEWADFLFRACTRNQVLRDTAPRFLLFERSLGLQTPCERSELWSAVSRTEEVATWSYVQIVKSRVQCGAKKSPRSR